MPNNYSCSPVSMDALERNWLEGQHSETGHVRMHQCASALLEFGDSTQPELRPSPPEFERLFFRIAQQLELSTREVWQCLCEARKAGILAVAGRLSVSAAARLQTAFDSLRKKDGNGPIVRRVVVGAVRTRFEPDDGGRTAAVAEAAAAYWANVIPTARRSDDTGSSSDPSNGWIGVSGGKTMLSVVNTIVASSQRYAGLRVLPLAGEAEPRNFEISANSVVVQLANGCGQADREMFSLMTMPYVGVAQSNDVIRMWRENLLASKGVQEVIGDARRAKFAFTGVGGSKEGSGCALERLREYCAINAKLPEECVGDICYLPINKDGQDGWRELTQRLVGLDLEDLRNMAADPNRRVFAVASGEAKVEAVIAAVRGGLVNGLNH